MSEIDLSSYEYVLSKGLHTVRIAKQHAFTGLFPYLLQSEPQRAADLTHL